MFSHLLQLNSIRVFEAAARLMSFKAAALELNVTATAVSHQIRGLEEKLGTLLFERKTRSISLTPQGAKLAPVAYQSLHQLAAVLEEISDTNSVLTISTTSSFAAMWLIPRLDDFHTRNPEIQVAIKTGEHLEDLLKDRRIGIAIRYGQFKKQDKEKIKLVTERIGMYATKKYLDGFSHLEDANLIETKWKNSNLPSISWEQFLKPQIGEKRQLKIRAYDQEVHVIQAALAGKGIALVSSLLVQTALEHGWLEELKRGKDIDGLTYYMLIPPHKENSRKVEIFRRWLIEKMAEDGHGSKIP